MNSYRISVLPSVCPSGRRVLALLLNGCRYH